MVLLGLILMILGAGVGALAFIGARDGTGTVQIEALGFTRQAAPTEVFLIGVVAMLLVALGWALLAGAARRRARARRQEREDDRIAELEDAAESERHEHERRFEQASLRDQDLRSREDALAGRAADLDAREREVARLEAAYREQVSPSVADVVAGRAEGNVTAGTAHWSHTTPREPNPYEHHAHEHPGDADAPRAT